MKQVFNGGKPPDSPPAYVIVLAEQTFKNILQYKSALTAGQAALGTLMQRALDAAAAEDGIGLPAMSPERFIEALLATKRPQIFAESAIRAGGTDWTHRELALLGDINVTMAVKIFDNGVWSPDDAGFRAYAVPLEGQLLFTPGPLLGTGKNFKGVSPDYSEVVAGGRIDQEAYNKLIERRLLPLFAHANDAAARDGKPAFITLPGIGCGAFAGPFKGGMGAHLNKALQALLEKHGKTFPHIKAVYFDPFAECGNQQQDFHGIAYRVRPASLNPGKPQLCAPADYAEGGEDLSGCRLYKIVAWDHASLPGNDFFGDSRFTDDGVSAAATNSMEVVTGVKGDYAAGRYTPPDGFSTWEDVADAAGTHLKARGNVKIVTADAQYLTLAQYVQSASPPPIAPRP